MCNWLGLTNEQLQGILLSALRIVNDCQLRSVYNQKVQRVESLAWVILFILHSQQQCTKTTERSTLQTLGKIFQYCQQMSVCKIYNNWINV